MTMTCTNKFVKVYQTDCVKFGNAHALYAIYKSKASWQNDEPPLFTDHIDFTFDYALTTSIEAQAEAFIIAKINGYASCTIDT